MELKWTSKTKVYLVLTIFGCVYLPPIEHLIYIAFVKFSVVINQ